MPRLRIRKLTALFLFTTLWFIILLSHQYAKVLDLEKFNRMIIKVLNSKLQTQSIAGHRHSIHTEKKSMSSVNLNKFHGNVPELKRMKENKAASYSGSSREISWKLWFMKEGNLRPNQGNGVKHALWPDEDEGDRIIAQLMYTPENYTDTWSHPSHLGVPNLQVLHKPNPKRIFVVGDSEFETTVAKGNLFWRDKCPVSTCSFIGTKDDLKNADAIVFKGNNIKDIGSFLRQPKQVWILNLESPLDTGYLGNLKHVINWTASYRHDSDIVTPYAKFVAYNITSLYTSKDVKVTVEYKNYAAGKRKKVAWFMYNCTNKNSRFDYGVSLKRYIQVDIFGSCETDACTYLHLCLEVLDRDYKFYLAFEDINCMDYITETFFVHGLRSNVIPIVMGARREDYTRVAPPHSFIHVEDFNSPKHLARYLHKLDANDALYNQYFAWKSTGELVNTHLWCRVCALLHSPRVNKSYVDIESWWRKPGVCHF